MNGWDGRWKFGRTIRERGDGWNGLAMCLYGRFYYLCSFLFSLVDTLANGKNSGILRLLLISFYFAFRLVRNSYVIWASGMLTSILCHFLSITVILEASFLGSLLAFLSFVPYLSASRFQPGIYLDFSGCFLMLLVSVFLWRGLSGGLDHVGIWRNRGLLRLTGFGVWLRD